MADGFVRLTEIKGFTMNSNSANMNYILVQGTLLNLGQAKAIKRGLSTYANRYCITAYVSAGNGDNDDGSIDVLTSPEGFSDVKDAMLEAGLEPEMAEVTMSPATSVDLGLEDAEKVLRLVDALEDLDDVQNVYTNADFSDEVLAQLA